MKLASIPRITSIYSYGICSKRSPGTAIETWAPHFAVSHRQVIVIDVSERRDSLVVLINPRILDASGVSDIEEGCLSVPGIYDTLERAERVKVRACDQNGNPFTLEAQGVLAVCIQHEMDHLKGKVFVEYLSSLKQTRVRARLAKQLRKSA